LLTLQKVLMFGVYQFLVSDRNPQGNEGEINF